MSFVNYDIDVANLIIKDINFWIWKYGKLFKWLFFKELGWCDHPWWFHHSRLRPAKSRISEVFIITRIIECSYIFKVVAPAASTISRLVPHPFYPPSLNFFFSHTFFSFCSFLLHLLLDLFPSFPPHLFFIFFYPLWRQFWLTTNILLCRLRTLLLKLLVYSGRSSKFPKIIILLFLLKPLCVFLLGQLLPIFNFFLNLWLFLTHFSHLNKLILRFGLLPIFKRYFVNKYFLLNSILLMVLNTILWTYYWDKLSQFLFFLFLQPFFVTLSISYVFWSCQSRLLLLLWRIYFQKGKFPLLIFIIPDFVSLFISVLDARAVLDIILHAF